MKAIYFQEHGNLSNVEYGELPVPTIAADEILLAVKAAALNRLDLWVLEGWAGLNLEMPHVMGSDGAGVVAAVGEGVHDFVVGDRVAVNPTLSCGKCEYCTSGRDNMCDHFAIFGEHVDGFMAEYTAVPARNLLKLPSNVSFAAAAAASLVYVTAWHSLIKRGGLQAGETVLVVGAGGGVNSASIQIAKLAGAGTIYVVGSNSEKCSLARALGADITINRGEKRWGNVIFKATARQGVDIVIDNVGAATYGMSLRALKKGGRLLTVGNSSGATFMVDNRYIFGKQLSIIGSTMGTRADYVKVMGMLFNGRLHPVIDSTIPLAEAKTALQRLQDGDIQGKLLLTFADN